MIGKPATDTPPSRLSLYVPFALLAVAILVHAVYWVMMSGRIHQSAQAWIEDKIEAGYAIEYSAMTVRGYPFRFTLHLSDNDVSAPASAGGWRISVEHATASAQFYNLNHWIVGLDERVVLDTVIGAEDAQYELLSEQAQFSLMTRNGVTRQIGAEITGLTVQALSGPQPLASAVDRLAMTGRMSETGELLSGFIVEGLRFDASRLDNPLQAAFGETVQLLQLDSVLTEFDTLSLEGDPLAWTRADGRLIIRQTRLDWGPAALTGSGEVTLDRQIRPAGRLSVVVSDPESLISALEDARLVYDEQGAALRLAAMMAPRRDEGIALPFLLQDGGLFLGPARIGDLGALN
jgi:hypothetical protein